MEINYSICDPNTQADTLPVSAATLSAEWGDGLVYIRLITGQDVLRVVHTAYMLSLNRSDMDAQPVFVGVSSVLCSVVLCDVMDSDLHCKIFLLKKRRQAGGT